MAAQARGPAIAIGNDAAITHIVVRRQQAPVGAVLGAEAGPVEAHAGDLADEVGAEGLHEGALDDEDVGAEELAGGYLAIGVAVGAGGVDDVALGRMLDICSKGGREGKGDERCWRRSGTRCWPRRQSP